MGNRIAFRESIPKYTSDPDFPFFVSFPRTGSHWFRIVMELYLGIPCLVESWTIKKPRTFWAYHRHDRYLEEVDNRNNVLYLYRNPVETLCSEMYYWEKDFSDHIDEYISIYSNHLIRWLYNHDDVNLFEAITYEDFKDNPIPIVSKALSFLQICHHGDSTYDIDKNKIISCYEQASKQKIKEMTKVSNPKAVNINGKYNDIKNMFREKYSYYILQKFIDIDNRLNLWEAK